MSLLDRIFYMAVDETVNVPNEALNELYEQIEAARTVPERMSRELAQLGLDEDQARPLMNTFWTATLDYERQGFLNGFRFGFQLARELADTTE